MDLLTVALMVAIITILVVAGVVQEQRHQEGWLL